VVAVAVSGSQSREKRLARRIAVLPVVPASFVEVSELVLSAPGGPGSLAHLERLTAELACVLGERQLLP
jgi:hypothetical protein